MKFLNKVEASLVLSRLVETFPTYHDMEYLETMAKVRNRNVDDFKVNYSHGAMDWNDDELDFIKNSLQKINKSNTMEEFEPCQWNFIKVQNNIEFGFPFSIENFIVLPQSSLRNSMSQYINRKFITMLIHEQLHIHQRQHPALYDYIFQNKLGYIKPRYLLIPSVVKKKLVHNPDENCQNWIIVQNDNNRVTYWWSVMILDKNLNLKRIVFKAIPHENDPFIFTLDPDTFFFPDRESATTKWASPQEFHAYTVSKKIANFIFKY